MKVKVAKWGNSLGVRLPRAVVKQAGLKEGSEVNVTAEGNDLRLRPLISIPRYRLEDLLAEIDRTGPGHVPETVDWGPDRGSEIIEDEYSRGEITLDDIVSGRLRKRDASGGR